MVGDPRAIVVDGTLDELDPAARARAIEALQAPSATWTLLVFTASPEVARALGRTVELEPAGANGGVA
jgi:hypothetical protein